MNKTPLSTSPYTQEPHYERTMNSSVSHFWQNRTSGFYSAFDNTQLHWCQFIDPRHTKAIVIVNGRIESVFKYQELFYDLFHLGYDIYSYDHRGQGHSKADDSHSDMGHVEQFNDYVIDLKSMVEHFDLNHYESRFIVAHSMGGAITLRYLQQNPQHPFSACVASAPMLGLPVPWYLRPFAIWYTQWLNHQHQTPSYAPGFGPYTDKAFADNRLSQSKKRYQWFRKLYHDNPELQVGGPSITWVWQSLLAVKHIMTDANKLTLPLLILQAEHDKIVANEAQQKLIKKISPYNQEAKLVTIANAYHELLFEKDELRNQALEELIRFIELH
jgi:lysophospholipase